MGSAFQAQDQEWDSTGGRQALEWVLVQRQIRRALRLTFRFGVGVSQRAALTSNPALSKPCCAPWASSVCLPVLSSLPASALPWLSLHHPPLVLAAHGHQARIGQKLNAWTVVRLASPRGAVPEL